VADCGGEFVEWHFAHVDLGGGDVGVAGEGLGDGDVVCGSGDVVQEGVA
jgi:hypothetical protein